MEITNEEATRGIRTENFASGRVFSGRCSRSAFGEGGKGPRNTLKTRKAKMEITNEEATRGIRTANFASVRVFSGRLVRGKLDIQTAVGHGTCMICSLFTMSFLQRKQHLT